MNAISREDMGKLVLYIATSLDGYIARPDGDINWLEQVPNPNQIDHGYQAFLEGIGALVMGRKTYEKILSFGIDWPYPGLPCLVASQSPSVLVSSPDTQVVGAGISEAVLHWKATLEKDIWLVGGGQLLQYFLREKLVDELVLTLVPITLGEGIPLFPSSGMEQEWELGAVVPFETGLVSLSYSRRPS
jgi:dihydrofolate reductase